MRGPHGAGGLACPVKSRGGKAEPYRRLVFLVGSFPEPGEPRRLTDHQRQHARGNGIERSQMSHAPRMEYAADFVYNVVGGPAFRLVHHDDATQRHCRSSSPITRVSTAPTTSKLCASSLSMVSAGVCHQELFGP